MKLLALLLCTFLLGAAAVIASPIIQQQHQQHHRQELLGARECTWGPSYWCFNITNAAACGATTHCIQTVWEKHAVAEDTDSICKICLDMVQQARDQLLSNTTQEDLRAVFEGSCRLIPLKPITKMCIKTVDDFIPELVEALSSQMNPQAVCSVAGLCNNAAIDKMLADAAATEATEAVRLDTIKSTVQTWPVAAAEPGNFKPLTCRQCNSIGAIIAQKFHAADRDQLLEAVLAQCGRMSSFSDACASLVLQHFNAVHAHMSEQLTAANICHLSGTCADRYHRHEDDDSSDDEDDDDDMPMAERLGLQVRPLSAVGVVKVNDDIPCELCKQLVHHLKELLIANTTETEFKSVLEGLCKQTAGFKAECLSIVDQYYGVIYTTLLTNLNENEACCMIEICPRGLGAAAAANKIGELRPLLPADQAQHLYVTITAKPRIAAPLSVRPLLGADEPHLSRVEMERAQLPIDVLLGAPNGGALIGGGNLCVVCEYAAHFVQTALASTQTEAEIKDYAKTMCDKVTPKLRGQCDAFIDQYGDALIALLIQEVDPRAVCPRLFVCPAAGREEAAEVLPLGGVQINRGRDESAAGKCPLCLFAVAQAVSAVKEDRSVQHIKYVLERLCGELPGKMKAECADFVDSYTPELVRMLADDFTPQAICTNLKLCDPEQPTVPGMMWSFSSGGDIATNEIPDLTFNGDLIEAISVDSLSPNCLLCEELVKEVEKRVSNKKSRAQLKEALEHACAKMPKLTAKCDLLVDRYGDRIVDLIIGEFTPKQICRELGQCILSADLDLVDGARARVTSVRLEEATQQQQQPDELTTVGDSTACVFCQTVMAQLEKELTDKTTQKEIEDAVKNICHQLPKSYDAQCSKFIDQYTSLIIALIDTTPPKQICAQLQLCTAAISAVITDSSSMAVEQLEEVADMPYVHAGSADTTACVLCQTVMQQLEKELTDKATQKEIEDTVKNICHQLPQRYDAQCSKFIDAYATLIIALIDSTPPKQICASLSLCATEQLKAVAETKLEIAECAVCHAATMAMVKVLEDPKVERSVENVMDRTCSVLPAAYNDRCIRMVDAYGQSMMNIIANSSELQTLCTKIGMCHPNEFRSFAQMTLA